MCLHFQKENNGVIMVNFWSRVIRCDEKWMETNLDDVVGNIEHIKNLVGIDHIGIGADYDGLPYNDLPIGLEDVSRYPNLFARLLQRPGWTIEDIKKVIVKHSEFVVNHATFRLDSNL